MKKIFLLKILISALLILNLAACVDPYYSGPSGGYNSGYGSPGYGNGGYYGDSGYDERRERKELERERDRMEDERRRLEEERRRNEPVYRPPPPPVARPQERCPSGFSPSENKCSQEERRRGCRDMRLPGGLGCVSR